jgi:uncharacterized protein (TIRG00374 family)
MSHPTKTAQSSTPPSRLQSWRFWFGLLISLGCLVWAVRSLDWRAVQEALAGANLFWISAGVGLVLLTIATRLARWAALLYPRQLRHRSLLSAMLVGQLLNYFAPARAGDLVRAYLIGDAEGESKVWALGTIAVEKMWDIAAMLVLVVLISLSETLPEWLLTPARVLTILALAGSAIALGALRYRTQAADVTGRLAGHLSDRLAARFRQGVERLLDALEGLRHPRVWFWAAVWSAATWGIGSLTNHAVLLAFGLSLPLTASALLMVVLQMGVAVPSLPGRVGLYEGLTIVVLALFGVEADRAFAAGLALHAVSFVPPILLGLYFAWRLGGVRQMTTQDQTPLGV